MNPVLKIIARIHAALYQMSSGRIGNRMGGQTILLLHHVGAKSGKQYITPVGYVQEDDAYLLVAAAAGAPKHPGWYHNLKTNPSTKVEIMGKQINVMAAVASQDRRDQLWTELSSQFPQLIDFQAKTSREIPIVLLHPQKPA